MDVLISMSRVRGPVDTEFVATAGRGVMSGDFGRFFEPRRKVDLPTGLQSLLSPARLATTVSYSEP